MGRKKTPAAVEALPPSAQRGETVLGDFTLVLDMDAIDRFESGGGGRSVLDLLAKIRFPELFGAAKLSDLVDITRCAMIAHHADDLPNREAVRTLVVGSAWKPVFTEVLARAFPAEGEPAPAP